MFYTYIIYSAKLDRYYVGSCENVSIRLQQHNAGRNQSTRPGMPWRFCYEEPYSTRSEAYAREMAIKKKKSKKYIEWLINKSG
jgi:putative endonuclease